MWALWEQGPPVTISTTSRCTNTTIAEAGCGANGIEKLGDGEIETNMLHR